MKPAHSTLSTASPGESSHATAVKSRPALSMAPNVCIAHDVIPSFLIPPVQTRSTLTALIPESPLPHYAAYAVEASHGIALGNTFITSARTLS